MRESPHGRQDLQQLYGNGMEEKKFQSRTLQGSPREIRETLKEWRNLPRLLESLPYSVAQEQYLCPTHHSST